MRRFFTFRRTEALAFWLVSRFDQAALPLDWVGQRSTCYFSCSISFAGDALHEGGVLSMPNLSIVSAALLILAVSPIAFAEDAPKDDDPQTIEVVKGMYTALIAPSYCPHLKTNPEEFENFLKMGNWTSGDFAPKGKFEAIGTSVMSYFGGEVKKNKTKACDDAFKVLNKGDVKLLVKK